MAGFAGAPRLWSRNYFSYENVQYVFDATYNQTFSGHVFGSPCWIPKHDYSRIALVTASDPIGSPGTIDGGRQINRINGWSFNVTIPEQGVTTTTGLYASATSVQPAGGLVPVTTGPAPLFDAFDYSSPYSSTRVARWAGAYSEDGTIFAALQRRKFDGQIYLSVTQGGSTLVSKSALSIKHVDQPLYSGARYRTEVKVFALSATNIFIFHIWESGVGVGDKALFLSVWDGSTISSTTRLGSFQCMDFEVVRGPGTGLMYLLRKDFSPDLNVYVHTIIESTRAFSAAHRTDLTTELEVGGGVDWRPGGRMALNKVMAYKGLNYIVHFWSDRLVCYTYADATPTVLTKRYEGPISWKFGFTNYRGADLTGIEYDPVSDTAMLCVMEVYTESGGSGVETRDTRVLHLRRHAMALDSASFAMEMMPVEQTEDYVFQPGSDSFYLNSLETLGYLPSWVGVDAVSLIMVQVQESWGSSAYPRMEIFRFANWRNPVDISTQIDIVSAVDVDIAAVRDYESAIAVVPGVEIDFKAYRARQIEFKNTWTSTVDTSINGQINIVIEPVVVIGGAIAETHNGEIEIVTGPDVYIEAVVERTFLFNNGWIALGRTFIEEFHEYANEERATVWGLPPIKIAGSTPLSLEALKTSDIAQRHCDNMVAVRIWDHDSLAYPVGWQFAIERLQKVGFVGAENILAWPGYFDTGDYVPPTAFEVWDAWKHSPGHYANLMLDWSASGPQYPDLIFSMLAITLGMTHFAGGYPNGTGDAGGPEDAQEFYITNNFVSIEEVQVEALLTVRWQKDVLEASLLQHSWESKALYHVKGSVVSPYSMPLHMQHVAPYGAGVTGFHESSFTHSVAGAVEFLWPNSARTGPLAHIANYDIEPNKVVAFNELWWSRSLSGSHLAEYDDARRVAQQFDAPYDELPRVQGSVVSAYDTPYPVQSSFTALYGLRTTVQAHHILALILSERVVASVDAPYVMQDLNPVSASSTLLWDIRDAGSAAFTSLGVIATMNGKQMSVGDGYITGDYDTPGYTFECSVPDLEFIRGAKVGDELAVNFAGTPYVFFLSNISDNSQEKSAAPEVTISGLSPVYLLDVPYAEMETFAPSGSMLFSDILQEALGVSVDFSRHIDWLVPFGRAQGASQTPLAFARGLLESVGSCLLSNPDGSLYVLQRYPHGFNALPDGAPEHILSETDAVFTRASSYQYAKGYNRYRVRDSEASFEDQIEYDEDEDLIYAHISPYRSTWEMRCTLTPNILLNNQGEETVEKEELWDFKTGTVTAGYPILDLVSVTWLSDVLGGLSFEPHSTKVTTPVIVNFGYGLAKVTYRTKRTVFKLVSSVKLSAAQLIIVEK